MNIKSMGFSTKTDIEKEAMPQFGIAVCSTMYIAETRNGIFFKVQHSGNDIDRYEFSVAGLRKAVASLLSCSNRAYTLICRGMNLDQIQYCQKILSEYATANGTTLNITHY